MRQILLFFIRFRMFLLYLSLMLIAISLTIQTRAYPKSALLNSANFVSGSVLEASHGFKSYFNLASENAKLVQENIELKQLLYNKEQNSPVVVDSLSYDYIYNFIPANVIRNNYNSSSNILLINKGNDTHLEADDGVVTPLGLLGVVDKISNRHATVISILNMSLKISAQLEKSNHFGTLSWDGNDPQMMQLTEIPKTASVTKGDTIITSGRSLIFPKGIKVGTVKSIDLDPTTSFYTLEVELFNDMTNLDQVYIIKNTYKKALETLINTVE